MSTIIIIGVALYLFLQSIWDIKYMQVPVFLNNIALFATFIPFCTMFQGDLQTNLLSACLSFAAIILIFLLHKCGMYGSGDAKAIMVIYFAFCTHRGIIPFPDFFPLALCVLVADIGMILYHVISKMKVKEKKRVPYFPFLTAGYITTLFLLPMI